MKRTALAAFAMAGLAAGMPVAKATTENTRPTPKREPKHIAPGSIAEGNRHGGQHLHQRETARRLRQQGARSNG
jgi:hypothetical protein